VLLGEAVSCASTVTRLLHDLRGRGCRASPACVHGCLRPSPKVELAVCNRHSGTAVYKFSTCSSCNFPLSKSSLWTDSDIMLRGTRRTAGCTITSAPFTVLFACAVVLGERAAPHHHHHNQRYRRHDADSSSVPHWSEDDHDVSVSYRSVLGDPGMRWGAGSGGAPTLNNPRMLLFFYNLCSKVSERDSSSLYCAVAQW
jgi:hypothetical protein